MATTVAKSTPILLKTLVQENPYPYFLRNENISEHVYIAQRAHSVDNALHIISVWNREGYNVGETPHGVGVEMPYNKYLYNSNTEIREIRKGGGDDAYRVLRYKKDGKVHTLALLKYS